MNNKERASLGGLARGKKLSAKRKREISIKAGNANAIKYGKDYFSKIRQGMKFKGGELDGR